MDAHTPDALRERIREAGVVGAGGAGFPTYKKLEAAVEHVIANGAECEPLLQKDRAAMAEEPESLLRGLELMRRITGARQATIALKEKNKDIAASYREAAGRAGCGLFIYEDVYPAGDEYVLVYEITGRRIPPGGIPLAVGCVVDNVETIINIAHAVEGRPVTHKYVTITGAVANPMTTVVPVGISIRECLEGAGGCTTDDPVVLTGGLMMGGVAASLDDPVTKTMGGVIALPRDHYLVRRKTAPRETYTRIGHGQCDQCSMCTELCPRYLLGYPIEPHRVMRTLLMTGQAKQRGSLWAQYCCECNVCSLIACPEELDPKNICVDAKQLLRERGEGWSSEEADRCFAPVHPARKGREIPIPTVLRRLGLTPYAHPAPFTPVAWRPPTVTIPLDSHVGQPAAPAVREGDRVRCGDVVGRPARDALGCPAHASIDGVVASVTPRAVVITA